MMKKIVALVPMKHTSVRVPKKNYRNIGYQKPLLYYILQTLSKSQLINKIVVDTDSPIIKKIINKLFKNILIIDRPKTLLGGNVPMNEILLYDTSIIKADVYFQTHSTNPLLKTNTIEKAIKTFLKSYPTYDSLFGVTKVQARFWDQLSRPINHNQNILLPTQILPPIYKENSNIYIFTRESLVDNQNRIGSKPFLFDIDQIEAMDIDEITDFQIVDLLLKQKG